MKHIAVILSGCGFYDGAEIRESVLTLLALETASLNYEIFAPDISQHHVVNHLNGEATESSRNVLEESARIARGNISPLSDLNIDKFDGVILPGGFGVAKNLCSFAFEGHAASADRVTVEKLKSFNQNNKPIGAICISPALVAITLQGKKTPLMTVGQSSEVSQELEKLGIKHQECGTDSCVIDSDNKIVTTPAYMDGEAKLPEINKGIASLVEALVSLT